MRYVSTRGRAPILDFEGVLLAGLASDGGLYVPERWPTLSRDELASFRGRVYADVAHAIISRFTGDTIDPPTLRSIVGAAYAEFGHAAVAPLAQLGPNHRLLELFHGPTLAFKDIALQVLGRLYDHFLERHDARHHDRRRHLRRHRLGRHRGDPGAASGPPSSSFIPPGASPRSSAGR